MNNQSQGQFFCKVAIIQNMYIAKTTTPKLPSIMHTATISNKHETASDEQLHRSSTTLKLRKLRLHRIRTDALLISKLLPL
jgi:hypothetical protein